MADPPVARADPPRGQAGQQEGGQRRKIKGSTLALILVGAVVVGYLVISHLGKKAGSGGAGTGGGTGAAGGQDFVTVIRDMQDHDRAPRRQPRRERQQPPPHHHRRKERNWRQA